MNVRLKIKKYKCFSCDDFSPCILTVEKVAKSPICCPYTQDVNKATWEKVELEPELKEEQ